MKNWNFSLRHYGAPWHHKYLLLALIFTLGSCQKDSISDMMGSETDAAGITQQLSTSRSSGLESDVVEYAQWMINKVIPLVKDPLVYDDIKAGNYSSARVVSKLNTLGFSGYGDFANQLVVKGSNVNASINSGGLKNEKIAQILQENLLSFDFSTLSTDTPQAMSSGGPHLPCYDQLIHELGFLIVRVAAILATQGPEEATREAAFGVLIARVNYMDCIHENYPLGGG